MDVNESFLHATGFERKDVINQRRADLDLWMDPEQRELAMRIVQEQGRLRDFEASIRNRKGPPHRHLISAEVIELDGRPCLLTVSRDITERKRLEEQLYQAQKLESVGRLAGGVAHDLNNVLTVIIGHSQMALRGLPEGAPLRGRVEEISLAGERAAALTQQLLAFSRKQVIQPRPIDLNAVVVEMNKMLRSLLRENIEMVTRLDPELGQVMSDPGQINQVLMNLMVNASDAMPDGGRLIIQTSNAELDRNFADEHPDVTPGPYVLLEVSDTGAGMDENVQQHIFEPFFTTKDVGEGTGLGLSTVYGIVRQSRGWIGVSSEPGKGTTFQIYLPRVDVPVEPEKVVARGGGPRQASETVLLVEDQEDVRKLARSVLETSHYRVLEAAGGAEALALAREHAGPIHLMLTDVVMPGMTGKELAGHLKPLRPEMKVLYMSGYTENIIAHGGFLETGIAFIAKPLTPDALLAKIAEVLDASSPD